ncbi:hypothetical protein Tco_1385205, partial [Tanacetum coccineum]
MWGMIYKKNVDYAELIWEDFQFQIDNRHTNAKRWEHIPYPRFTKVIINHFLSNRNSLPKRQASFINKIKYGSVLGKLKFVHKGEEHQKYGMSIPDSMMSDAIRNSTHYMTYLALSTNNEVNVPKVSKGQTPRGTNGSEKAGNVKAIEEIANKEIVDKEIADEEMADEEKAEDDRDEDADQAMNEQAGGVQAKSHVLEPAVPNPNSSLTLSSAECGNQFINANPDVSITNILKDTTEIEIQSMVDVPIYQEDPIFYKDVLELEKKFEILSKIDHAKAIEESVQANVINEVKNQLPKLLPKVVSDFVQLRMEGTVCEVLQKNLINLFQPSFTPAVSFTEYELKNMLFDMMQKSGSFQEHEKHLDLYNALIGSIGLDDAIAKGDIDPTKVLKKRHHDDKDKDPSVDSEKGKKKRRRKDLSRQKTKIQDDAAPKQDNSIWFKQDIVVRPETLDPDWHEELNADDAPEQNCFNELVNT